MQSFNDEVVRYLGYGKNRPEAELIGLIDEIHNEVTDKITPKSVWGTFDIKQLELEGNDIFEHLKGAKSCILFA